MTYLAAAVQRSPGLTLEHGIDRSVAAIEEAGREGAGLIVFPETWIPSYPYYHGQSSNRQAFSALYQRTFENSIAIPATTGSESPTQPPTPTPTSSSA